MIRPGLVVIFDGPDCEDILGFTCVPCCLSPPFGLVVLDPGIETLQSAVLLADPGFSALQRVYKDIVSEQKGFDVENIGHRRFISKISPIVRKTSPRPPWPCPWKLKGSKPSHRAVMMKFSGVKRKRLAELSLADAVSAAQGNGEEIPPDYRTAKQEKLRNCPAGFRPFHDGARGAMFLRQKLEDGKAENMFQSFELLVNLPIFSFPM